MYTPFDKRVPNLTKFLLVLSFQAVLAPSDAHVAAATAGGMRVEQVQDF